MDSRRAFTIVELLTVIAIIALLVGLLMPALNKSRQLATRLVCGSYLRALAALGQVYLDDNEGFFPSGAEWLYAKASDSEAHPIGCRWHDRAMAPNGKIMSATSEYQGQMWSYLGRTHIGPCPTFRRFARSRGCENPGHRRDLDIRPQYSYTMNGYLGSTQEGGVLKVSEVRGASEVFFFGEENSWSIRPDRSRFGARWLSAALSTRALDDTVLLISPSPEARDCFATYHAGPLEDINRGFGNVAFVDGHVEIIRAKDQLRKIMHGGSSRLGAAGNLSWAWAGKSPPPGGWDGQ
ncbi:MAG: type II secretion system protein [Planctomycetota bacterium]